MKTLTASDRKSLIRLAASLPKGDKSRRAILSGLKKTASTYKVKEWNKYVGKVMRDKDEGFKFIVLPPQPRSPDELAYKLLEKFEGWPAGHVLFKVFMPDDGDKRWRVKDLWETV